MTMTPEAITAIILGLMLAFFAIFWLGFKVYSLQEFALKQADRHEAFKKAVVDMARHLDAPETDKKIAVLLEDCKKQREEIDILGDLCVQLQANIEILTKKL